MQGRAHSLRERTRGNAGRFVRPLNSDVRLAQLIPVLLLLAALLPSLISGVYFFTSPKSSPVTLRLLGSVGFPVKDTI